MRVGIYVSGVAGRPGFENVVSGHIQLPLRTIGLLRAAGVEVELITSAHAAGSTLPAVMPSEVQIHQVVDSRVRIVPDSADSFAKGSAETAPGEPTRGMNPRSLVRQVREISDICQDRELDVLHLFGHLRTAYLAGGLRLFRLPIPAVATLVGLTVPARWRGISRFLLGRVDRLVVSTEFGMRQVRQLGLDATLVRHGTTRDILSELDAPLPKSRIRVLFWRDPSPENGADVCASVFRQLAPLYPDLGFDFAIRPFYDEVQGLNNLEASHRNIHVHRFPYRAGVSLASLLAESICVVAPYRTTSVDPQLAIAETLAAGVAVLSTDIRSNGELVRPGENGLLVQAGDVSGTAAALREMLDDPERTLAMGRRARAMLRKTWNWDGYAGRLLELYGDALDVARSN